MNRADQAREFFFSLSGVNPRLVNVIGLGDVKLPVSLSVPADKVRTVRVLITVAKPDVHAGSQAVSFALTSGAGGESYEAGSVFVAGGGS